jgi:hypothetical protein
MRAQPAGHFRACTAAKFDHLLGRYRSLMQRLLKDMGAQLVAHTHFTFVKRSIQLLRLGMTAECAMGKLIGVSK